MKIKVLHLIVAFCFLGFLPVKTLALNYTITFTGKGASSTVDSVIVQNLTRGTSITVPAGNALNLIDVATAVEPLGANNETIRVYPASVVGKYKVSFYAKQAGTTQLNAFSLDGRKTAAISTDLPAGIHTFELSLSTGIYVIQVTGNEYAYTAKLLSSSGTQGTSGIVYSGTEKPVSPGSQKAKSSRLDATTMFYTSGDQLLYKAVSGNYSTIVTDVPTGDKTTNFKFVPCADADGNYYTVVTIGAQTWMAENMKTTKYNDSTAIPLVTDKTTWWYMNALQGYCWYFNDANTYKNKYGALYNWYTVNTGKLAPTGWHVPTDAEWTTLGNYLTTNGYNYDGSTSGNYYAKSLSSSTYWANFYAAAGDVAADLSANNRSGFSALPGGSRFDVFASEGGGFGAALMNGSCAFWSTSEYQTDAAWYRYLNFDGSSLGRDIGNENAGFSVRCVKDTFPITTTAAFSVTTTTAMSGGNIADDGVTTIIARGVCWSTSANPTIADSKTTDGTGSGTFTSTLTGLTPNTTYNIRVYATNSANTVYGKQVSFTTNSESTITDLNGNVYHTVNIGTQTWMVENLKTTQYNDGTDIPLVTDNTAWSSRSTGAYCWYNNDPETYKDKYGALYNWYTVKTGKLAPIGWHVATDGEWSTLESYLIANGYNYDGSTSGTKYAKSLAATTDWTTSTTLGAIGNDLTKNNSTGFSAFAGGWRNVNGFDLAGGIGWWWSSTESFGGAWMRGMFSYQSNMFRLIDDVGWNGLSVRCVRDN